MKYVLTLELSKSVFRFIVITIVSHLFNFKETMCITFDASGGFNRPTLVKYRDGSDILRTKYVLTLELSKSVSRFELAQTV
jgi:hypothetical protein